jgi:hypothetical protein
MKLKIYILKKHHLIWSAIVLAIIIVSAILFITIRTTQTFNFFNLPNSYKADINNDGKIDTVMVKVDDVTHKYTVNVVCSDENGYILEPDSVIKSFGDSTNNSPINVTFNDISGDGNQEIFIQSSDSTGPILNVFKYTSNNIERIVSGRYFMYGVINNPVDETRVLVLCSEINNKIQFSYLKTDSGNVSAYLPKQSMNLGSNTLSSIVNFIEKQDVEAVSMNLDEKMQSDLVQGNIVDGIIKDVTYSNYDIPSDCTYILRTNSVKDNSQQLSKLQIKLSLQKYDALNPIYTVASIEKIK